MASASEMRFISHDDELIAKPGFDWRYVTHDYITGGGPKSCGCLLRCELSARFAVGLDRQVRSIQGVEEPLSTLCVLAKKMPK